MNTVLHRILPAAWAAALLYVLARYATAQAPPAVLIDGLAVASLAWLVLAARDDAAAMLRGNPLLFDGAVVLAVLAFAAQLLAPVGAVQPSERVLPQTAVLLCLPALAVVLRRQPVLQAALCVFACATAAWHFVALPMEALTGIRLGWHRDALFPRDAGPLHFQAAGLAQQAYFFAGLYLPLFYLGWGWAWEQAAVRRRPSLRALLLGALVAWVAAVACVQSRSALIGAALASGLLALHAAPPRWRRVAPWIVGAGLVVLGVAYLALFSQNKSGPGLRWAYAQLYLHASFDGRLFIGHGLTATPPATMRLPDYPISHSHNDLVQVLYSWGLPALLAYACFLFALVRLAWRRFAADRAPWALAALLALLPNVVTDLGVQHYEKAAFLVLLAALCAAQSRTTAPLKP